MFVIMTPKGYVAGFNKTHQIVQVTDDPAYMKSWKRKGSAKNFLDKYSNAGYGLNSVTAEIIEIEGSIVTI